MVNPEIVRELVNGEWVTKVDTPTGGGGTPAGDDGQVQFNDSGAFGASANLTVTDDPGQVTLGLQAQENQAAVIATIGIGAQLTVQAADGDADHVGGELTLASGSSGGQNGGDFLISAGLDSGGGDGGNLTIASGNATDGDGGEIRISANGNATAGGRGGQVIVSGGHGTTHGGNLQLSGGATDGNVQIYSGDGNQYIQLDNDNGLQIGATKLGFFQAPSVPQPAGVAVDAAAIHAALVSLGLITGP